MSHCILITLLQKFPSANKIGQTKFRIMSSIRRSLSFSLCVPLTCVCLKGGAHKCEHNPYQRLLDMCVCVHVLNWIGINLKTRVLQWNPRAHIWMVDVFAKPTVKNLWLLHQCKKSSQLEKKKYSAFGVFMESVIPHLFNMKVSACNNESVKRPNTAKWTLFTQLVLISAENQNHLHHCYSFFLLVLCDR